MQTLKLTADQLQPGDKLLAVNGITERHPHYLRELGPFTLFGAGNPDNDGYLVAHFGGLVGHTLSRNAVVRVERPETQAERMAVRQRWVITFRDHEHFSSVHVHWGETRDGQRLLRAMFLLEHGRDMKPEEMDDYLTQVQDEADATIDEYTFLAPC